MHLVFFPLHYREYAVTGALPVILTPGLWRWISHINEKGHRGGLPDFGSHGSAVSTACSNSPVSPNCWRTNREAEAARAAYHYNKSSLGGADQEGEGQRRNHGRARGAGVRGSQKREVGSPRPRTQENFPPSHGVHSASVGLCKPACSLALFEGLLKPE